MESLEQIERPVDNQFGYAPPELAIGEVRLLQGEAELARAAFEAARLHLEDLIEGSPGDHRFGMALAKAYAGLGRREEALRAAERSYALMPVEKESYRGARQLHFLAEVCTVIGESDRAIAALERLLAIPSRMTAHRLRLELRWRPLRGHPRFEELTGE